MGRWAASAAGAGSKVKPTRSPARQATEARRVSPRLGMTRSKRSGSAATGGTRIRAPSSDTSRTAQAISGMKVATRA